MFLLARSPFKIAAIVLFFTILVLIFILGFNSGGTNEREKLDEENTKLENLADDAEFAFDQCPPGMWDFAKSRCKSKP